MRPRIRLRLLAAVAAGSVVLAGVSVGSAATLPVQPASLAAQTTTGCLGGAEVTVTRTDPEGFWFIVWIWISRYRAVEVSGLPAACAGTTVALAGTTGTPELTGTVPAQGGTVRFTGLDVPPDRVFRAVVDGWHAPVRMTNRT